MSEAHPITFRLKVFNAWRRGNEAPQPDPKTVGDDIDSICDIAKRLERERDEALEECAKWHGMAIEADKRFVESVLVRDEESKKSRREHDLANEAIAIWKKTKEERDALQDQLDEVRVERDEWKQKFIQQNKDLGCEMMDPGGTIWDYAKKLQDENKSLQEQLDSALGQCRQSPTTNQ